MRKINIEVIPNEEQRYPTLGDYFYDNEGVQHIKVSEIKGHDEKLNKLFENLVVLHELAEITMTEFRGITEPDIMNFDLQYEKEREDGLHEEWDECGDDIKAPYHLEHQTSTIVEQLILASLGLSFTEYNEYFKTYFK